MPAEKPTLIGVFHRFMWRSDDEERPHIIGFLQDGTTIKGNCEGGKMLQPGLSYEFYGDWVDNPQYGKQFHFNLYVLKVPHSQEGIVAYLQRYGVGIGPVTANRIWDAFGAESVKVLRLQPDAVADIAVIARHFPRDKAHESAYELSRIAILEDTKIGLTDLFTGFGFPTVLVEECCDRWKEQAPARIKWDPYTLLVHGMSGCGFARCDALYMKLGLPPDRLKRQVICLWHALNSDSSGDTWMQADKALERLGQMVSGTKLRPKRAVQIGCRSGWLGKRRDADGVLWLAEGKRAENEAFAASKIKELSEWSQGGTVALRTLVEANKSMEAINEQSTTISD